MKKFGVFSLIAMFVQLAACGGGGSDPAQSSQAGDSDLAGSANAVININNGQSVAVDVLEILGMFLYSSDYFVGDFKSPASGKVNCFAGGTKDITVSNGDSVFGNAGDSATIVYSNCKATADVTVQGEVSLVVESGDITTGSYNTTFSFSNYAVSNGSSIFSKNGTYRLATEPGMSNLNSSAMVIGNGDGSWTVESLTISVDSGSVSDSVVASLQADSMRFGFKVNAVTEQSLVGYEPVCPDSGKLGITAPDGSYVSVLGASGQNLLLDINGTNKTLACAEVAVIRVPPTSATSTGGSGGFTPPPAP